MPAAAVDRSVRRVLAAFGQQPDGIHAIPTGNVNDSWDVTASSMRWILRRYSTARLPSGIPFEHDVLRQLAAAGWPVPVPFAAPDGTTLVKVGGWTCGRPTWPSPSASWPSRRPEPPSWPPTRRSSPSRRPSGASSTRCSGRESWSGWASPCAAS